MKAKGSKLGNERKHHEENLCQHSYCPKKKVETVFEQIFLQAL